MGGYSKIYAHLILKALFKDDENFIVQASFGFVGECFDFTDHLIRDVADCDIHCLSRMVVNSDYHGAGIVTYGLHGAKEAITHYGTVPVNWRVMSIF